MKLKYEENCKTKKGEPREVEWFARKATEAINY